MKTGTIIFIGILIYSLTLKGQQVVNMKKDLASELTSNFDKDPNPIEFAKKESIKGRMDFELKLKDEKGVLFVFDGIAYDKEDFAILLWALTAKKINIENLKTARLTWEEIYMKKLGGHNLKAFKKGYKYKI